MDLIYPPHRQPSASREIDISGFFTSYQDKLLSTLYKDISTVASQTTQESKIAAIMGRSDVANIAQLSARCDPAILLGHDDPRKQNSNVSWADLPYVGSNSLQTLQRQEEAMKKSQGYRKRLRTLRKTQLPTFISKEDQGLVPAVTPIVGTPADVTITIRVFKEFILPIKFKDRMPLLSQDFMVLGSQKLTVLRDQIYCMNDTKCDLGRNKPESKDLSRVPKLKDLFPSSAFYFGQTFYSDGRPENAQDYGRFIAEWAENHPRAASMGPFSHQPMESTTFFDLKIRLGIPYVFIHLGDCEHLVSFIDVRMWNPTDPVDPAMYPLTERAEPRTDFCDACDLYFCDWIVEGNERLPFDPTMLCHKCFIGFHYKDDRPVGEFVFHPYPPFEKPEGQ